MDSEEPPSTPPFLTEPLQPGIARCGHEDIKFRATGQPAELCHRCMQVLFYSQLEKGRKDFFDECRNEMEEMVKHIALGGEPVLRHIPIFDDLYEACDDTVGRCTVHHPVNVAVGIISRLCEKLQSMIPWATSIIRAWESWYHMEWNAESPWNEMLGNVPSQEDIRDSFARFLNPIDVVTDLPYRDSAAIRDLEVCRMESAAIIAKLNEKVFQLEAIASDVEERERVAAEAMRVQDCIAITHRDRKILELEKSVQNLSILLADANRKLKASKTREASNVAKTVTKQQ